MMNIE